MVAKHKATVPMPCPCAQCDGRLDQVKSAATAAMPTCLVLCWASCMDGPRGRRGGASERRALHWIACVSYPIRSRRGKIPWHCRQETCRYTESQRDECSCHVCSVFEHAHRARAELSLIGDKRRVWFSTRTERGGGDRSNSREITNRALIVRFAWR
jgi:hypothetical protein